MGGPLGARKAKFSEDPLRICGEGCSLMMEWSKLTVVTLTRVLKHLRQEYKLFGTVSGSATSGRTAETGSKPESQLQSSEISEAHSQNKSIGAGLVSKLPPLDIKLQVTDLNMFIYGLTPGTCKLNCGS